MINKSVSQTLREAALPHREICPGEPDCVHCPECNDYPLDDVDTDSVMSRGMCEQCYSYQNEDLDDGQDS